MSVDERILVLTTGGTIDKVYFDARSEFEVGDSVVGDLLVQAHVTAAYDIRELMRKDSLELTDEDRRLIHDAVRDAGTGRVVVTHGTDTMARTARALLDLGDKTVVLTGSLAPARFARTDAVFNVGMAFAAVQTLGSGVYIVMNGQIFDGARVEKDRSLGRFVASAPPAP